MPKMDLSKYGIKSVKEVLYNPTYEVLYNEETKPELEGYEKGHVTELGASLECCRRVLQRSVLGPHKGTSFRLRAGSVLHDIRADPVLESVQRQILQA